MNFSFAKPAGQGYDIKIHFTLKMGWTPWRDFLMTTTEEYRFPGFVQWELNQCLP